MAVIVNTNVDSLRVQKNLTGATDGLSVAMQRMSTGLKVLNAADDAAGTVIAARMKVQMEGNQIAQHNVQNATALLQTTEGHLDVIQDNLSRIRDLTLQAKNGTYSQEEKQAMQDEVAQRIEEIDRVSGSSKYSSLYLFGGDLATSGAKFQVGANATANDTITASEDLFKSVKFTDIVKDDTTTYADNASFNIATMSAGQLTNAINALDKGLDNLTSRRSIVGSAQNRLESALDTLTTQYENLSSAKSVILDADIAQEASNFTQQNILQQVSTSLLAQANQAPAIALSLI